MPRIPGTSHAQTVFLRAFIKNRTGPAPADWPTPPILKRWLRRPAFLRGLQRVMESQFLRSDLHLSVASAQAAQSLESLTAENALNSDAPDQIKNQNSKIKNASTILRLSQLHRRFVQKDAPAQSASTQLTEEQRLDFLELAINLVCRGVPTMTVAEAGEFWTDRIAKLRADLKPKNGPASPTFARDLKS